MTDTADTAPQTPTRRDRLMATTDPTYWAQTFITNTTAEERENLTIMTRVFTDAIEVGRQSGQRNPGGHYPGEVQEAIVAAFTEAHHDSGIGDDSGDGLLGPSVEDWLPLVEPAMKRLMAFVTGRALLDPPDLVDTEGLFDQDAPT